MANSEVHFAGPIPETYDRLLVPLLFAPYAADLAARARALGPGRVLEVAAGTGALTAALLAALPEATIEATDLNEAMLARASSRVASTRVRWSRADAQHLPFGDAAFDLVACQFGAMFFPDRPVAFREARRVLAPGGSYLSSVWDGLATNPIARIVNDSVAALFSANAPDFMARLPHGSGDPEAIERDLRAGGFTHVRCDAVTLRSRAASARDAAVGLCEGTPLRHEIVSRDPRLLPEAVDAATRALRAELGDGPIDAGMRAFVFAAR